MRRLVLLGLGALTIAILGACYDPDGLREDREAAQREVFEDRVGSSGDDEPAATSTPTDPAATPARSDCLRYCLSGVHGGKDALTRFLVSHPLQVVEPRGRRCRPRRRL